MTIPFKKDPSEFNQRVLFPSNIFDLLADDHECYIYEEIFKQLDTTSVENRYSVLGQNAYHPKLIVGILIYAYSQGVFSSRQIKKRCHEDLGFMYISHIVPISGCSVTSEKTTMSSSRNVSSRASFWPWKLEWYHSVM